MFYMVSQKIQNCTATHPKETIKHTPRSNKELGTFDSSLRQGPLKKIPVSKMVKETQNIP